MPLAETATVALRYELDGPPGAPVVLLANSLGTTVDLWADQLPALAARFRVLRYDSRGHGGSAVPPGPYSIEELGADAVALLDALGIERASVCGVSLGGMVAMWVAANAPERVERLALCCTSAYLGPPEAWAERAAAVRAGGPAAVADAVLARWLTPAFRERHPEATERVRAMLLATPAEGYAACCEAIAAMDQREAIGAVAAPTLVVVGADDPATPPEHGEEIARRIAGSSLVVVPDAAHLANVEQAALVTAELVAHLTGAGPDPVHERGVAIRRAVLGAEHVERAAAAPALTADFQAFITRYAWGEVWGRPGLDRRTRSLVTVAMLVALNRPEELALHLRAARTNGVTVDELRELLLHSAIYCGVPAANSAFALARRVLGDDAG